MSKAFLFCAVALCASPAFAKIVKANEVSSLPAAKVETATAPVAPATTLPVAPAVKKAPTHHARPHLDAKRISDWRAVYEEAKNLLVADQKYLIQYEEEESTTGNGNITTVFSKDDVESFQKSVETITDYRAALKRDCLGNSSHAFGLSLDKFALALDSFHRRALPLVGDISENNNLMVLLVNRTSLRDATVLTSRYLQSKKQRFKDGMTKFLAADTALVTAMTNVAKTLKVDLGEDDFNRAYGLRDSAIEMTSLWPRDTIFEAAQKLSDAREAACVVTTATKKN